ncbi:MAG: MBL fold metallo-hydrolase [Hoeflea sp.]|uniref:MBL fold metallo-hydrolase n=1 Tax=Hoeflea sp. TaxID=1940281 RepID=UPI003299A62A
MALQEIAPGVFVETEHLGSNNSIISTRDGLVLIDSPHRPTDAMRWRRTAASMGDVVFLINTDHHIDHTMGNYFLPGTVVSHEITRRQLVDNAPSREYVEELIAVIDPEGVPLLRDYQVRPPTVTFVDRMALDVGGLRFDLTHRPGHTPNSAYIELKALGVVFSGDLFCELGLPAFVEAHVFEWLEAARFFETIDAEWIVPGHGAVSRPGEVTPFRQQMEELIGQVSDGIDKGDPRDAIANRLRFEDRIHISTGGSPSYPDHLIELFQRKSIEAIYDQIVQRQSAA